MTQSNVTLGERFVCGTRKVAPVITNCVIEGGSDSAPAFPGKPAHRSHLCETGRAALYRSALCFFVVHARLG